MPQRKIYRLISRLLVFIALLVGGSLLLIGSLLRLRQALPFLPEHFANVTCHYFQQSFRGIQLDTIAVHSKPTKLHVGVVSTNFLTLLVGEKHVGRKATFWGVRIFEATFVSWKQSEPQKDEVPFLRLPPSALDLDLRVLAAFGILLDWVKCVMNEELILKLEILVSQRQTSKIVQELQGLSIEASEKFGLRVESAM